MNGKALTVTFDEALDTGSVPAPGAFWVTVESSRRYVATGGVAISGKVVTLTLASAVLDTDTVKVRYTKPSTNPLQDAQGHDVATFADQDVTNNSPDTTPEHHAGVAAGESAELVGNTGQSFSGSTANCQSQSATEKFTDWHEWRLPLTHVNLASGRSTLRWQHRHYGVSIHSGLTVRGV